MNMESNIVPALNLTHSTELSTEEFQNSLYEFFEEKGIISNLRAHLRAQMVTVLKDTTLGKAILFKKTEISPKLQAHNLLVAEYLLKKNYHYTLSVFSSEVPLNNSFSPIMLDDCKNEDGCKNEHASFHFSEDDVNDILQAIGLNQQPDIAEILSCKYKCNTESLLACILHHIPSILIKNNNSKEEDIKSWLKQHEMKSLNLEAMVKLLRAMGVNTHTILRICELVKEAVICEVNKLKNMKDQQLYKLKKHMSNQAIDKVNKYKERYVKLEEFYKNEKHGLEDELHATKQYLSAATRQTQARYKDINELNSHIHTLELRLKQQEQTLLMKESSLQQRQEVLESKQRLIDQQLEGIQMMSHSQQCVTAVKSKAIEMKCDAKTASTSVDECCRLHDHHHLQAENEQLRETSAEMHAEIVELKHQNSSYQRKIEELLQRTTSLLGNMEARNRSARRPLACLFSPRNCAAKAYYSTGEEGGTATQMSRCSSSEEVTPTGEMLQEAKLRLLELERESVEMDQQFEALPKSSQRAASVIQRFQENVSLMRDSITKIFNQQNAPPPPPPDSGVDNDGQLAVQLDNSTEAQFVVECDECEHAHETANEEFACGNGNPTDSVTSILGRSCTSSGGDLIIHTSLSSGLDIGGEHQTSSYSDIGELR